MTDEKKLTDAIIEAGENFQPDAMEDYDERVASGEFEGKTDEEIRDIYFKEALADEEAEEMDDHYRDIDAQEEAEND